MSMRGLAQGSWGPRQLSPALHNTNETHHDQTRERKSEAGQMDKVREDSLPRLFWLPV